MKKFLKELWLKSIIAFLAVFILIPQVVFSEEIRVLNWKGYGTDEKWAVDIFSSETGIKVVHDYFNSEQEMMTKLRTTPGYYDVVLINSAFTKQVQSEGLISLINSNKIKNYSDLSPGMAKNPSLANNGNVYGVAWVWGVTSFAVDSTVFNNLPDTIEVLWDPKYKGKVSVRDDAVEIIHKDPRIPCLHASAIRAPELPHLAGAPALQKRPQPACAPPARLRAGQPQLA